MRQTIIFTANKEIGTKESPPNSNRVKYWDWYGHGLNGQPWCAAFVSWVYAHAGHPLPTINHAEGYSYVPTLVNWAVANHKVTADPQTGDIVCFDWQKGKPDETPQEKLSDHTGIFLKWVNREKGIFESIEGNTSVGNDSDGGCVMLRERTTAFVSVFVNPLNLSV